MQHTVRLGESLASISAGLLGDSARWSEIAEENGLIDPNQIYVGQKLQVAGAVVDECITPYLCGSEGLSVSAVPAVSYVFVLADEINPVTQKLVRRVIVHPKMAAEAAANVGRPVKIFPNPERFGFTPTDPASQLPIRRHVTGMKPSAFSSASSRMFGASRMVGKPFWIDVAKAQASGATIHSTQEILRDLDVIAKKAKTPEAVQNVEKIKGFVVADSEVLIRNSVPPAAVKSGGTMAITRGLQGVQIVGFTLTAVNMTHAAKASITKNSVRPIAAESIRQVGGWSSAWAGIKLGAAGGAAVGITTGPGVLISAGLGSIGGGIAGFFAFDWIADHLYEN